MFPRPRSTAGLELARSEALKTLAETDISDPQHKAALKQVEKLSALIVAERREPLNVNAVLGSLAGLGGILTIVAYEQKHVFGSQAAKFIGKLR